MENYIVIIYLCIVSIFVNRMFDIIYKHRQNKYIQSMIINI